MYVKNVKVLNSPARVYSVSNPGPLIMSKLTIDDCVLRFLDPVFTYTLMHAAAGDQPNSKSNGQPAGHNTDGFDCSTTDLTIESRCIF